MRTTI